MSGGGSSPAPPPPPPPVARIEAPIEVDDAKKRVKSRAKGAMGRESTILAGGMMRRNQTSEMGKVLGPA